MRLKITKDFVLGVLVGTAGTLYFTAQKFADIIRKEPEKVEPEIVDDFSEFDDSLFNNVHPV